MPAKRAAVVPNRAPAEQGYGSYVYSSVTSPENRSVVASVAMFAAGVAFLHSSWAELLLPA